MKNKVQCTLQNYNITTSRIICKLCYSYETYTTSLQKDLDTSEEMPTAVARRRHASLYHAYNGLRNPGISVILSNQSSAVFPNNKKLYNNYIIKKIN